MPNEIPIDRLTWYAAETDFPEYSDENWFIAITGDTIPEKLRALLSADDLPSTAGECPEEGFVLHELLEVERGGRVEVYEVWNRPTLTGPEAQRLGEIFDACAELDPQGRFPLYASLREPVVPRFLVPLRLTEFPFPKQAVQEVAARPEWADGVLLTLEEMVEEELGDTLSARYFLPIYDLALLGYWRHTPAYSVVAHILTMSEEEIEDLIGDYLLDGFGPVLAAVSGGDQTRIREIIEDPGLNEFSRACAFDALLTLFAEGATTREELADYFQHLLLEGLEKKTSFVWTALVYSSVELRLKELTPLIEKAVADGWVEMTEPEVHYVLEAIAGPAEAEINKRLRYPDGTFEEFAKWYAFTLEGIAEADEIDAREPSRDISDASFANALVQSVRRDEPKVGRNDPCPCGSGKKFKKCCW